jgi:hypothetical protein
MASNPRQPRKLNSIWRATVESGFIIFLFYSNLLMSEFTRANGQGKSWVFAIEDIFTPTNFAIAAVCGLSGHLLFEYFRRQL